VLTLRSRFTGLWRHPDFVRLWAGETVSVFGSLIGGLALLFTAVIWLDASPLQIAILAACQMAPGFLIGLLAGVWADRLHRRPILIACDIGRFAVLATIPLAALFDLLSLPQLYLVALVANTLTVFFDVAYQSYLPTLVRREELVEGNSKLAATASIAEFGSFSLSGWLVQLLKGPGAVLIDALSFLVSAYFVWRIRTPEPPPAPIEERRHMLHEAREGMQVVLRQPLLRSLAASNILLSASQRMVGVVFLLYLNRELGFGPGVLGMIFAVGGVTSLGGAYLAGRPHWFGGLGPALVTAMLLMGLGMLFMPLTSGVSVFGASLLIANQLITDPAATFFEINSLSLRQGITPDRLQGRMNATMRFTEFGGMLAGTAMGGILGELVGLRQTLFLAVGLAFVAALTLALSPILRLRTMPESESPIVPEASEPVVA
jgi:MFS family permease